MSRPSTELVGPDQPGRLKSHRPGPAADVRDPPRPEAAAHQPVERQQAPLGRRIVPGAERLRRLDLQPDPIDPDRRPVVAAEDHEPPRLHRRQLGSHLRHPVPVLDPRHHEVRRTVQLRQQREPRGSAHFVYLNRTYVGLFSLLTDLGAVVKTAEV